MTKTKQDQVEQEVAEETAEIRDIKSRRSISLLFSECPLCKLKFTEFKEVTNNEGKQYFQLIQYGTNPDGTGYESYHCQSCDRFFMMIVAVEPIMAKYEFKPVNEKQKPRGGIAEMFEEIFGRGNGPA